MSAILSNLYMIDFDIHFSELAKKYNALYKRYSDDITIICSVEDKKKFIDEMYEQIAGLNLVIQKKS